MTAGSIPPKFLSLEFHTKFFPDLLRDRFRPKKKKEGTAFVSSVFMEGMVGLAVCLMLVAIGIPPAVKQGSTFGWLLSIVGVGGIVALVIFSVYVQRPFYTARAEEPASSRQRLKHMVEQLQNYPGDNL